MPRFIISIRLSPRNAFNLRSYSGVETAISLPFGEIVTRLLHPACGRSVGKTFLTSEPSGLIARRSSASPCPFFKNRIFGVANRTFSLPINSK
ncbi:MAG: hypothetical protein ACUVUG_09220, partial [Candidatus Aminicenantia bacterium]